MPYDTHDPFFRPELFAHGRLLYRFPGSDACRFSPKLAYRLVQDIAASLPQRPSVLWDPFCGAGLMVSLACLFFPKAFQTVVASDIAPEAVACCKKNLLLVSNAQAARKRLKQMHGLQKMNLKSYSRWGAVAEYLGALMPRIEQNECLVPAIRTFTSSAFQLPSGVAGNVHFVADLPYGRSSHMVGDGCLEELVDALAAAYPAATMTFVMPQEFAENLVSGTKGIRIETRPCSNGRSIVRARQH